VTGFRSHADHDRAAPAGENDPKDPGTVWAGGGGGATGCWQREAEAARRVAATVIGTTARGERGPKAGDGDASGDVSSLYDARVDPVLSVLLGAVLTLVHVGAIVAVLVSEKRQPAATLAWLFALVFLPAVGVVAWLVIGQTSARRVSRAYEAASERVRGLLERRNVPSAMEAGDGTAEQLAEDHGTASLLALGDRLATTPASGGNRVDMLVDGAATYAAIREALDAARDHVHVEFYIFRSDATGRELRDRLVARARDGVEVRVLCDAVGSVGLDDDFWKPLRAAGGEADFFRPASRLLRMRRSHFY